ncbi:MAG: hypothetical protein A3A80_03785 [Candidatus Terrybacteria bacterium RIFCSPLOWO2_01_FULL_44_24]|uniref:Uncharacterized protein n=1 Tax=Candidatus Terrybacteria bacterium RIFCSPHIGHO2_01_FULL_43_35 TaxID=1802361 RepID=A0A1G2PI12_9BACT|nr:MAG: hypothetical protein A2828_00115 [Candidatus Terrybacteria bacterium RIFCSPHIGHO2_01_FULL_43_35]OHA49313.1 MAG: hypothetical protein A3B75_02490 [Candidatus Terrybacteria bacterium RIFCSPHIGHO2_02_FULL_43_14]OHA52011.1 MAG: hypothetical protein A3A80_03785 [Candidatus Terrybacteria bacterium RIFCSPLOWO2_01_FULL_44_24]
MTEVDQNPKSNEEVLKFLGIATKPHMGGVEMAAFSINWGGKTRRLSISLEDDLLDEWGYNIAHHEEMPPLTELLQLIGTRYFQESESLQEEPHGYIFTKNDFLDAAGNLISIQKVVENLKAQTMTLHRPHRF